MKKIKKNKFFFFENFDEVEKIPTFASIEKRL